jgi:hypothetical protein
MKPKSCAAVGGSGIAWGRYRLAILESQERSGKLVVVGDRRNDVFVSNVHRGSANPHGAVGRRLVLEARSGSEWRPERWADHSCR